MHSKLIRCISKATLALATIFLVASPVSAYASVDSPHVIGSAIVDVEQANHDHTHSESLFSFSVDGEMMLPQAVISCCGYRTEVKKTFANHVRYSDGTCKVYYANGVACDNCGARTIQTSWYYQYTHIIGPECY